MGDKNKKKVAWSDDLSYDSEEEREKERLALAELAEIETPEKPSYTDDNLNKLVKFIKNMVCLYHLHPEDWNDECIEIIKTFFMEPKYLVLSIFFYEYKLTALLDVPKVIVLDLNYFLRDVDMIFSVDSFHDEITFGTIVESADGSFLKILENVYTPAFLSSVTWPKNIKNEFCMKLYSFLLKLTDLHNKLMGLTVMYIPRDGIDKKVEEASNNKELVKRLENVVVYWIQQIKTCLEDDTLVVTDKELICPLDELNFWIYRYENLNAIQYQIRNANVVHISIILKNAHSSYIKQFNVLILQIEECISEAKSNIEFLQLIREQCSAMEDKCDLSELPDCISNVLNIFRFIWTTSPFYNTSNRLTKLCKYLSNQVIIQCSVSVDFTALFNGKTRATIVQLQKCIDCCKSYKEIYDLVSKAHSNFNEKLWDLNEEIIFNYVDAFIQRCVDMLEICNGMIIFGRIDEIEEKSKSRFMGTNGEELEKNCKRVEVLFKDSLSRIENVKEQILDVQDSSWNNEIVNFRNEVKYIEEVIENLMITTFQSINNIEEAIQILCATFTYSKRENLRKCFIDKTTELWNMLENEIQTIKKDIISERDCMPSNLPFYSGQATMIHIKKKRLVHLHNIISSAMWMLPCSNSCNILNLYKSLISTIDLTVTNISKLWMRSLEEGLESGLNRKLMCPSLVLPDLLDCNFDRNIIVYYNETDIWENIGLDRTPQYTKIFSTMSETKLLYELIIKFLIHHNNIEILLSNEEKVLFKSMRNACLKKLNKGIYHLTWESENVDVFISECWEEMQHLQNFIYIYKASNKNVLQLYEEMCDYPLINFSDYKTYNIEKLKYEIMSMWKISISKLLELYRGVIKNLIIVFEGFEEYIESVIKNWISYLKHYDIILESVLHIIVRSSLQHLYNRIKGRNLIKPHPVINVQCILINEEIHSEPSINVIYKSFTSILPEIILLLKNIPRLHESFNLPNIGLYQFYETIQNDTVCTDLNKELLKEVEKVLKILVEHMENWNTLSHLWKISKVDFTNKYVLKNPTVRDFDKDISYYNSLANEIQTRDSNIQIEFLIVNNKTLKLSLITHCLEWQRSLNSALKDLAKKSIETVYTSAKHSEQLTITQGNVLGVLQDSIDAYDKKCREIMEEQVTLLKAGVDMELLSKPFQQTHEI